MHITDVVSILSLTWFTGVSQSVLDKWRKTWALKLSTRSLTFLLNVCQVLWMNFSKSVTILTFSASCYFYPEMHASAINTLDWPECQDLVFRQPFCNEIWALQVEYLHCFMHSTSPCLFWSLDKIHHSIAPPLCTTQFSAVLIVLCFVSINEMLCWIK